MLHPRDIAPAIVRLRAATVMTLDGLDDAQLEVEALPGWSVADVFRHLADSDRGAVLGKHLLEFLPGKDLVEFERVNDRNLARLRGADRQTLRRELDVWGRRLARTTSLVPGPVAGIAVPTAFGRVPLGWMAVLRLYDEWVHQWDVATALGRPQPPMDAPLARLLAEFQLRALPAAPLATVPRRPGVVRVVIADAAPVWLYDLEERQFGTDVVAAPTVTVHLDVPTFCLVASDRLAWRDAEAQGRLRIEGRDRDAAEVVLDVVRVV